jgi:dinuclear metal center YbgI/SA1388 family protein
MPSPSYTVAEVIAFLREFAPAELAEPWDNVGLLVGDESWPAKKVLTCLTLTEDVAQEAANSGVGLVVSHHPLLFKAVKRITSETSEGRTLLTLLKAGVAVYSPHTAFDSAAQGINRRLAATLGLSDIRPLRPAADDSLEGSGRFGRLAKDVPLSKFLEQVRDAFQIDSVGYVGEPDMKVRTVAVACGSAAEFLDDAARHDCDVLLTGEARFHACLEARSRGVAMVLAGHYATERPAVEELAKVIGQHFAGLESFASSVERDPLQWSTR